MMTNSDNEGTFNHDQCDMIPHMPFMEECASKAGIIVEIGVGHGNGSTRAFARGLLRSDHAEKMHIGVDWDPVRPQVVPENYWHMVHGPSEDPATAVRVIEILGGRKPDIIFIDTIHTYEQMAMELPIWANLAKDDTLWIFHDSWMLGVWNHMSEAIKEFASANEWEFVDYAQESHGLALMRRKSGRWAYIDPLPRIVLVPQV